MQAFVDLVETRLGGVTRGSARESGAADGSRQACRSGYASGFSRNVGTTSAVQRTHPSVAYRRLVTVTPEKPRVRVLLLLRPHGSSRTSTNR